MKQTPFLLIVAYLLIVLTSANAALVAHYEFEETSGTTLGDSSGNGYNGNVIGSGDLNVSGVVGSAYEPGGSGSYGRVTGGVSTFGIGGNNARTISLWFKTPGFGGTNDQYRLIGFGSGAAASFSIVAEAGTNAGGSNRVGLRYGNGNVYFDADNSGTAFATNTWYHLAVVYDGTTLDLESIGTASDSTGLIFYVNGVEVDTAAGNLNNGTQALNTELSDFVMGAPANGDESLGSYPGLLDDVRVYSSVLSAAEIDTLASAAGSLPSIQSFTSSDSSVEEGAQVTLSWSASDYDTLVIEPGSIDAAALSTNGSGSTQVTVNATTTFTLTASNNGNDATSDVEVSIQVDNPNTLDKVGRSIWTEWYRPVDSPVFSISDGNNHDPIIFYEPTGSTYKYYLIISHEASNAFLWGTNSFSSDSADWTLIEGNYQIDPQYEFDDAVKVGGNYYLYEEGKVFTYTGDLVNSSGNWTLAGTTPKGPASNPTCDDIGVFYENGLFHIFGENGVYPDGFDGLRLSHYTSPTGVGDWTLVSTHAVDPNTDGGSTYGVGDPTIAKIGDVYYLFCDRESIGSPYRVTAWSSTDINQPFEYLGVAMAPRSSETDDWDNYRIQDADIQYIPELKRFIMVCNMMDTDGTNPDGVPPFLPNNTTRVVGTFYSKATDGGFDTFMAGFLGLTGADALVDADPDLDGATNGEEYAGGTLPDDPSSLPVFEYSIVDDGGMDYPTIIFDRITIDPNTTRFGETSNAGSLQPGSFLPANGIESVTGISEIGGFYEQVIYRSITRVDSSDSQFLRTKTIIRNTP